jgi:hypothetical protein
MNRTHSHYHLLTVKYLGPTNTRGSRIRISSDRFKDSRTFSFDSVYNRSLDQALVWVQSASGQFNVIGTAEGKGVDYIITDTFKGVTE